MSNRQAYLDRLASVSADELEQVLSYCAEEDCIKRFADLAAGDCGCIICMARRIYDAIFPPHPTVRQGIIRDMLAFVEDAREVYRPEAVVELGVPEDAVSGLTRDWGGMVGVIGLDLIQWVAGKVGADPGDLPYVGWQRIMRAHKRAIRAKVGLPAVPGEAN